jgi:tRNA nucleotidyltransferase/poly(A) polymerase
MSTTFDAIFSALDSTGVRHVIVGGIAVNLHGYQRFTKDVDVVIELIPEQTLEALEALQDIGYAPRLPVKIVLMRYGVTLLPWICRHRRLESRR